MAAPASTQAPGWGGLVGALIDIDGTLLRLVEE